MIHLSEAPALFGPVHITALVLILLANIAAGIFLRRLDEEKLLRLLHRCGIVMLVAEVWKQWFCYVCLFNKEPNLWFFPWQLCSMAMYVSFLVQYVRGKTQTAFLVFLSTYSLLGGIVALILPYDMLRPQVPLMVHSFAYQGAMLTEALIAVLILKKRRKKEKPAFLPATVLFLGMAAVAEAINVLAHVLLHDPDLEPNMFYITPFYPSTQPVLSDIAHKCGTPVEIAVYLGLIILTSFILYSLFRALAPWTENGSARR